MGDWWSCRNVVITGATGYLGSRLTTRLASRGARLHLVRHRAHGARQAPAPACAIWHDGDVRDRRLWSEIVRDADVIFHAAGQTSTRFAEKDAGADLEMNVRPQMLLSRACASIESRAIVVNFGTVTQAGFPPDGASVLRDGMPDAPATVYDLHKLLAEIYLLHAARASTFRAVSLRLSTVYGPGPRVRAADRGVLNMMARRALAGTPVTIYRPGTQLRDYIFVDDVVEALMAAAEQSAATEGQVFNIGSGDRCSLADAFTMLAAEAERMTGVHVPVSYVDRPADAGDIDFRSYVVDATRFQHATGWRPRTTLRQGIRTTLSWMATQRD
jgi:nucleoside-diphosphate-sugar epimerase